MTLNKDQGQHSNNELHTDAQRLEVLAIIKRDGPCTVANIVKATGLNPRLIRGYCEELVENGDAEFKLWRYSA